MSGGYPSGGTPRGWTPTSRATAYAEADARLGKRESLNLGGRATKLIRLIDADTHETICIAVRYHNTNVVTYYPEGHIILNHGGHHTATTREKIKTYARVSAWIQRFALHAGLGDAALAFVDNRIVGHRIVIYPDDVLAYEHESHIDASARAARALLPPEPKRPNGHGRKHHGHQLALDLHA